MRTRALVTLAAAAALLVAIALSLAIGARSIALDTVWAAITHYDAGDPLQQIVRELRGSRTIIGVLAGASLAVAGALMQALTRNPFADPGLLGINAGASLAVVIGIASGAAGTFAGQVPLAFLGAAAAAVTVYMIGARGSAGGTPIRLALAGVALTALLSSVTYALLLMSDSTLEQFRFWVAGSLTGRQNNDITALYPIVGVALVAAFLAARRLEAIQLGEDSARALGVNITATRVMVVAVVTLLAGAATAAAGPIAFIGLAVPHLIRALVGASLPWLLAASALGGAALVLVCDVIGRVINPPSEVPVGIMTAFLGGLLFAVLARRMRAVEL